MKWLEDGQELYSLQIRDKSPVIASSKGVFFYRREFQEWFAFDGNAVADMLLAEMMGGEFAEKLLNFMESPETEPQQLRELLGGL